MAQTAKAFGQGDIDQLAINTIRTLSMDAVQKANSGHPGTPMALAPVGYTIWQHALRYDPANPHWINRDRFILSVGHASMLLYSLLFLANVRNGRDKEQPVTLDAIKQFRQLSSVTPGHPEYRHTTGVETTTGPLAQGVANSVGMAIGQRYLASRYNKPGYNLFDSHIYAVAGDGCMMEGVSGEAASTAGHLKLSNLTWIYDSNHITIEGSTDLAFDEDVGKRFLAYGWDVQHLDDANDTAAMAAALDKAKACGKPSMIIVHSVIGFGAPHKAGTREAHGEPLGADEIKGAKKSYGWPEDAQFLVPDGVRQRFDDVLGKRGAAAVAEWNDLFARYRKEYPELAAEIDMIDGQTLPDGWEKDIPVFPADAKGVASRDSSQKVLNAIAKNVPWLIGGAADLAPSTKSNLTFEGGNTSFEADNYAGRNLHFGIREHAMGSICNGMALTGLRSYGAGFLIFSDYMKAPVRLSAIMELPVIYIFTHDSIGVGEDGPTHQPIEQLASLRAVPGMLVLRPGDANEVGEMWKVAMRSQKHTVCFALSRQALPTLDRDKYAKAEEAQKGAYILGDAEGGKPDVILIGTGSEVGLCVKAYEKLTEEGIKARVVSMPSWELFEEQDDVYRARVLPPEVTGRVTVEMAATMGWERYAGNTGKIIGMKSFGMSAPGAAVIEKFGFTLDKVLEAAREQAKAKKG